MKENPSSGNYVWAIFRLYAKQHTMPKYDICERPLIIMWSDFKYQLVSAKPQGSLKMEKIGALYPKLEDLA